MQVVYLIHFDEPYKQARHYIGWSQKLRWRLLHHATGRGSRLMAAVSAAGISWKVVRKWKYADRAFERKLHNAAMAPALCPVCSGRRAYRRMRFTGAST